MSAPLLLLTNCCCGTLPYGKRPGSLKLGDKLGLVGALFDAVASITCLVIGILGVTSTVAMPLSAAYALIGISSGITLLWIAMMIKVKCFKVKCCPKS